MRPGPVVTERSTDGGLEGVAEVGRLVRGELDDESPATLERNAHDDAAPLLGDLERTVTRPRLHGRHTCSPSVLTRRSKRHVAAIIPCARRGRRTGAAIKGRSRAGSTPVNARSALFDVYGDHLRARGGHAPVAALVRMLAPLGVAAPAVRTAISRMARQGWLRPERLSNGPGYALTPKAVRRLDEA